jgi:DNA-binding response OmpR family regulator
LLYGILPKNGIIYLVGNPETTDLASYVDVCVQRIRKKIDSIGGSGWIESIRGVGYRFRQSESQYSSPK